MKEVESVAVVDLAKEFMELMSQTGSKWTRAYFRFSLQPGRYGSVASYVTGANATIIDPFRNSGFFESMNAKGARLMALLEKEAGAFLVSIDSDFNYKIDFDFADPNRWRITKLNGGTGVPEGV